MKLNKDFIMHKMDNLTLLVPTAVADFHGLIQGNQTIGAILECLSEDTTEEKIVDALQEKYDGKREDMEEDVHSVVTRLREIGAIVD